MEGSKIIIYKCGSKFFQVDFFIRLTPVAGVENDLIGVYRNWKSTER
jgi:hypothetical protein